MVLFLIFKQEKKNAPCLGLVAGIELEQVLASLKNHLQANTAAPGQAGRRERQTGRVKRTLRP